jgi:synaptobrevin family protein YKT6
VRSQQSPQHPGPYRPSITPLTHTPRNSVREIGREINRTVAEATRPGTRQSKPEDQFTIHIYARSEGCAGIIVADQNYDKLVAHQLLSKILDEFTSKFPKSSWSNKAGLKTYQDGLTEGHLGWYIKEFQDPNNGDSIMKIQKELNETKETLQKAIQSTLERGKHGRSGTTAGGRPCHGEQKSTKQEHHANDTVISTGEKLDNLVAKSDNLSASSKMFYTQAKKQNSCCLVM